ncbi:sigma-54-dependent Fis family transcriptional regulator [Skermanella aerolata]|uniref:sigma-54-dependent Fis family transcriptional regulator n=1 Tax=Skermanella aerolata TaxID=393310 RepID=UPI001B3B8677|nr:sigma-54-dependent Fis family transcriptional regulator [Skermanella aerolata]
MEDHCLRVGVDLPAGDRLQQGFRPGSDLPEAVRTSLTVMIYKVKLFLRETNVTLLLADAAGTLIHVMDAGLQLCPIGRQLVRLGVNWHEASIGNNGMGTAGLLREPVAFEGKEHFYCGLHPFATAGYPITGPDGSLTALLGAVTDRRDSSKSLLGFLRLAGYLIEANLFERHSPPGLMLRLRPADMTESLGVQECLLDGLVSVDQSGSILGANRTGLLLMGAENHDSILHKDLSTVTGLGFGDLRARMATGGGTIEHTLPSGTRLIIETDISLSHVTPPTSCPVRNLTGDSSRSAGTRASERSRIPAIPAAPSSQFRDVVLETALYKAVGLESRKIPILITGESGVGKDYLVRQMRASGPRSTQPLVAINCGAIPRELIASELFGYEAGSFTGARIRGKSGKFVEADKGILFLDEIGDMALDLQATLLRVLDTSEIVPIGGAKSIPVDVHVVAATNRNLPESVQKGTFRRDLYYRLNGAQIWLPPLRERPDKMKLIQHMLQIEQEALAISEPKQLGEELWQIFMKHPWPGNIRELRNVLRSSLAMTVGPDIRITDLPPDFLDEMEHSPSRTEQMPDHGTSEYRTPEPRGSEQGTGSAVLADWEEQAIRSALAASSGNISRAARMLSITRATLYHKMARYGLKK